MLRSLFGRKKNSDNIEISNNLFKTILRSEDLELS